MDRSVSGSIGVPSLSSIREVFRAVVDIVCLHINRSNGNANAGGMPLQWELRGNNARGINAEARGVVEELYHDA